MMFIIKWMSWVFFIVSFIIMFMALLLSKKSFMDREKLSPFECGFDPKSSPRLPFSLHFFLIAMIFLIFDIEITLLIPFIMTMKFCNLFNYMYMIIFFIIILIVGTYHEWNQGALNWIT
uniref:NADH-ubiquinone oxidoreductase chain 3 n=1 Tax=Scirtidae sp. BMNH 1274304 TaxID=1796542 RepID=A0A126TFD5_9COLE|nr:NADH dehydrogenase subunit 3 [Scirtidae sp. BMNH 1274304]